MIQEQKNKGHDENHSQFHFIFSFMNPTLSFINYTIQLTSPFRLPLTNPLNTTIESKTLRSILAPSSVNLEIERGGIFNLGMEQYNK